VIPGATGGKAIPYGVYDLHRNEGWVSVGIDARHRDLRGAVDSTLVAAHGAAGLSRRHITRHHRRCRRQ
jgi:hypothetical protein